MRVLFLDIDGVLNTHDFCDLALCGPIHRDKMDRLNRIIDTTGAKVVVSSAWRYLVHRGEMNLTGLGWLLRSHGLRSAALVGITREDTMVAKATAGWDGSSAWPHDNERGKQITDWLRLSVGMVGVAVQKYAVVDDLDLGISEAGHPFVDTDGRVGITDDDADKLIGLLT